MNKKNYYPTTFRAIKELCDRGRKSVKQLTEYDITKISSTYVVEALESSCSEDFIENILLNDSCLDLIIEFFKNTYSNENSKKELLEKILKEKTMLFEELFDEANEELNPIFQNVLDDPYLEHFAQFQ